LYSVCVIGLLQCLVGDRLGDDQLDGHARDEAALVVVDDRQLPGAKLGHRLRQYFLLDQLIEDALEQHIIRQRLVFR
jgi:hypothetical protein